MLFKNDDPSQDYRLHAKRLGKEPTSGNFTLSIFYNIIARRQDKDGTKQQVQAHDGCFLVLRTLPSDMLIALLEWVVYRSSQSSLLVQDSRGLL